MNTTKYNEKYHNNKFNFLISKKSDMYRSIIDIDGLITKRDKNIKYCLMYDHKNNNDNPSKRGEKWAKTNTGQKKAFR